MEAPGMMTAMMMAINGGDHWSSINEFSDNNEELEILAQMFFSTSSDGSQNTNNENIYENTLYFPNCCDQQQESSSNFDFCDDFLSNSNSNSNSHYYSQNFSSISDISTLSYPEIDFPMSVDPISFLNVNYNCNPNIMEGAQDELSNTHLKLECDRAMPEDDKISVKDDSSEPKKRSRVSQKGKRNVRSKKAQRVVVSENEDTANSEEDSNETEEINETKVKTRASRGSATDPQSIYARKRRERINERLKTLQKLVPNGTKVDISTMLEEAVNYVNFLQVQIKLLSSEEMWRYAPLAYNGMFPDNVALDLLTKNI